MEYIYSALLLHKAGKDITEDAVKKVLTAAGVEVQDARVKALVAALDGVDIKEAIEKAAVPVAAAAPAAAAPAGGDDGADDAAKKAEDAKKKEDAEKGKEQAAAGLGALFG